MDNLFFDNNWRRALILTKQSNRDLDLEVPYIKLIAKKLPCSISDFCSKYAYEYAFDFDVTSKLIWPISDKHPIINLQASLEKEFPKTTEIVRISPIEAHGLCFSKFDINQGEDTFDDFSNLVF
jgi:hypothetical protein